MSSPAPFAVPAPPAAPTTPAAPPAARPTRRSATTAQRQTSAYRELTDRVQAAGLMSRRYGFYWTAFGVALLAMAGVWTGVALLDDSWWQLALAGALGVILAQLRFLGHEACHRQVFRSARRNEWAGRVVTNLLVGLSYGWWMSKHTRHHGAPNQVGKDTDIENGVVSFTVEAAQARRNGLGRWLGRRQGWFFLPLMSLQGIELHAAALGRVFGRQPIKHRGTEIAFLAVRILGYLALVGWLMPLPVAAAFVGVQLLTFGFLLGGAFAPNHIGMPIVPRGTSIDFLRRQVLMSRNIRGGPVTRFLMGGLDTQIEHHLFPAMPRPNLTRARTIVRDHCREQGIAYTETSLAGAYRSVLGHLNRVGLAHRDGFACPLAQQHRT